MQPRRDLHSETGATLVEVLVAIVILGLAAVAILAGLQMSVLASDIHRKQSSGGAHVRSYAEAIERYLDVNGNYLDCAAATAYSPGLVGYTAPSGYSAQHSAAEPLAGDGSVITTGTCPTRDQGVQRIKLTISSSDSRAIETLTIVVRRACNAGTACA
jgi:type II secretory pathway pseudopilin PulG